MRTDEGLPREDQSHLPLIGILTVSELFRVHMSSTLNDIFRLRFVSSPTDLNHHIQDPDSSDILIVAHWRWVIPQAVLDSHRCIGFHASPLPKGRGGSPIQNQIARGDYISEVCAFQVTSELDAGPVYTRRLLDLESGSISEIFERVAALSADMAKEVLVHRPPPVAQAGDVSTFRRLHLEDSRLNLAALTAKQVYDRIRMVDGLDYPRAFLEKDGWCLRFSDAQLDADGLSARVQFTNLMEKGPE